MKRTWENHIQVSGPSFIKAVYNPLRRVDQRIIPKIDSLNHHHFMNELTEILTPEQLRELASVILKQRTLAYAGNRVMLDKTWVDDLNKFADKLEQLSYGKEEINS